MVSKRPSVAPAARVLHEERGCLIGTFENVVVAVWMTQATGPLAEKLGEVAGVFAAEHPEGFSNVHVISRTPPIPTGEARAQFIAMMRRYSDQVACIGTVLEGTGFWASAVRSFIVGIRLVVPRTFEMQTYASIEELSAWLPAPHAARTGVTLDRSALALALTDFRDRVGNAMK